MACTVVVGGFFGDEGKGKLTAYLALRDRPAIVARGGVGPNAGHTVQVQGKTYSLRMIPSGFVCRESRLLIGPGVLVNPSVLLKEIEVTETRNRIGIDRQCAIIEQKHIDEESRSEYLVKKIGVTKSGVGACNADRVYRSAKLARDAPELSGLLADVSEEINEALHAKSHVLLEGSQGTFLSLFHGTYPFCTSKDVCASAICSDVGIGPTEVDDVVVVFKSFVTRVGEGPLEGQLSEEETRKRGWQEFGTVTGRLRRAAPFDFDLAKRAVHLNGATQAAITKLDVVFPDTMRLKKYEQLPSKARNFISDVEKAIGIPVTLIGTGPSTEDLIDRKPEKTY
ncbi:MAG: adenylosuccinate synthetase [Candidatus Bathyarchaeia archaeon]